MIRFTLAAVAVAGMGATSFGQWREVAVYEAPAEFDPGSPRFGAAMAWKFPPA
jgi:hypothetical protein